eukprot:171633-Chlamydomonas_euryale.AAC.1
MHAPLTRPPHKCIAPLTRPFYLCTNRGCSEVSKPASKCSPFTICLSPFTVCRSPCTRNPVVAAPLDVAGDHAERTACVGDLVAVHFTCKDPDGNVLESSYNVEEPLMFEVGAGDMMGNKLFQVGGWMGRCGGGLVWGRGARNAPCSVPCAWCGKWHAYMCQWRRFSHPPTAIRPAVLPWCTCRNSVIAQAAAVPASRALCGACVLAHVPLRQPSSVFRIWPVRPHLA